MSDRPTAVELIKEGHAEGDRVVAMHVAWEAITTLTAENERLQARVDRLCSRGIEDMKHEITTLTAELDALVEAIDAFRHIDRSGRRDIVDLEQLDDAVEKCLRLIES